MNESHRPIRSLPTRRSGLALLATGALVPALGARPRRLPSQGSQLDLEGFLGEAVPLAEDLMKDTSAAGQDRYLFALASLAVCLEDVPIPEMRETSQGKAPRTFLGANECEAPFTVLHWRLEPGARIGLHPHIYGNVVTLCLEGEVRIENYEVDGPPDWDTREPFRVRRTKDQVLRPGDVNTVNLAHGYVHGFVAGPEGARGLDLTTRIRPRRETPSLVVGDPLDAARALFQAHWRQA